MTIFCQIFYMLVFRLLRILRRIIHGPNLEQKKFSKTIEMNLWSTAIPH